MEHPVFFPQFIWYRHDTEYKDSRITDIWHYRITSAGGLVFEFGSFRIPDAAISGIRQKD